MASWERAADLGERLREVRVGLGLTQAAFGELLGVTDQTVSDWEGGRSRPTKTKLERLARKVGFPVSVFMEGGPRPATLPRRPVERRTGPTSTLEALAARLAFLRDSIRAYTRAGRVPPAEVLADWERAAADVLEETERITPPEGYPASKP